MPLRGQAHHEQLDAQPVHEPEDQLQAHSLGRRCLAEFLGTAFLVYIGCGALTASGYLSHNKATFTMADLLGVAFSFGLALAVMVYAIGRISGCHINPAVSIALASVRRLSWRECGAYIVAQLLGGLFGALLIAVTFGGTAARVYGYGATDYNTLFANYFSAIVVEAITTFFLVFVIMAMVIDKRASVGWAGLIVGLTLMLGIMVAGAVTGGNLNPARAFGPTIIQMLFGAKYPIGHMFVFFIGPIIGGIVGAFAYEFLATPEPAPTRLRRGARYEHMEPATD